ncbi:MAG: AraC family transcriptional regulator [Acidimicrobiales bacterium]|nr:AraC family transcriptional regulator [Acidimicrobiales bacterium]
MASALVRPSGPSGATVLTAWTGTLLRALAERGIDGAELAAQAGIAEHALDDPDRRIPLDASTRLWAAAVAATGNPGLGLDVARHVRPGTFHALGHAVVTSPTWRGALERIARFSRVTADMTVASIESNADEVTLVLGWSEPGTRPADEAIDAVLAGIVHTSRFLLDASVAPSAVAFERVEPADRSLFDRVFRCPLTFDAPAVRLTYDAATADRSVSGGNLEIARLHDDVTAAYLDRLDPDSTARRVREVLPDLLPGGEPSVVATARALNTSSRTLQRNLQDEGTSFRDVLRDVRRDLAIDYLRRGDHSVTEITYLLGFSETPTFSRAFKQWTGVAPSRHR